MLGLPNSVTRPLEAVIAGIVWLAHFGWCLVSYPYRLIKAHDFFTNSASPRLVKISLGEAGPSPDENFLWQVTYRGDKAWHLEIWLPERYRRKLRARAEPTTHILPPEQCRPAHWWNAVAFGDTRMVFK